MIESLVLSAMSGVTAGLVRATKRLTAREADRESAPQVEDARELERLGRELLNASVATERARGVSWSTIGTALGITRSSAHGRFADVEGARDPGAELQRAWQRIAELAGRHVTPLTLSVERIDADVREEAARHLTRLISDPSTDSETRLSAAEFLSILRGGAPAQDVEKKLRELLASNGISYHGHLRPANASKIAIDLGAHGSTVSVADRPDADLLPTLVDAYQAAYDAARESGSESDIARLGLELAALLVEQGEKASDRSIVNKAIATIHQVRPFTHDETQRDREFATLDRALFVRYRLNGARPDLVESVHLARQRFIRLKGNLGFDHPTVARALVEFEIRRDETDEPHADDGLRAAVHRMIVVFGADHPETMEVERHLAKHLAKSHELREAGRLLEQLLSKQTRVLGPHDPRTRETQVELLKNLTDRIKAGESEALDVLTRMTEEDVPVE